MSKSQRVSRGFQRLAVFLATLVIRACASIAAAHAATPCDFKGLSVGGKATPQEIMQHFGISKYKDANNSKMTEADNANVLKRAERVSLINAAEELAWNRGPACEESDCEIPYGVSVGNEPFPIPVGVMVFFDSTSKITSIDVTYDEQQWDEVLELLIAKYGGDWDKKVTSFTLMNYETKEVQPADSILLTHRGPATNPQTGDTCSITVQSIDHVFRHTTPPWLRSVMEIKLISKNF
jgi:hypothetical protein